MPKEKPLTAYKLQQLKDKQKEFPCGLKHVSIEEAMVHAEENLGFRDAKGTLVARLEPFLGSMYGAGSIVGWQVGNQKRFRVDFDPDFAAKNLEASKEPDGVNKGTRGVHVNEEDFTRTKRPKICHPTEASLMMADLLWSKWSSAHGRRGQLTRENLAQ